jgi:hypothetical protein
MNSKVNTVIYNEDKLNVVNDKLNDATVAIEDLELGGYYVRLEDVLKSIASLKVKPYEYNRGNGSINPKTVKKMLDNNEFELESLGEFIVAKCSKSERIMTSGHGRTEGLLIKTMDGKLTEYQRNFSVALRIVPESKMLSTYVNTAQVEKHKPFENLTNPNFFFGSQFERLVDRIGKEIWDAYIKPKNYKQLSYFFYRLSCTKQEHGKPKYPDYVSYLSLFECRKETTPMELCRADEPPFKVSDIELFRLADGIKFYIDIREAMNDILMENAATDRAAYKKLIGSSPFMALVVLDYVSGVRSYGTSAIRLAKRIFRNLSSLGDLAVGLTNSSHTCIISQESKINMILTPSVHNE